MTRGRRQVKATAAEIEAAVRRAGRSSVDPRERDAAVDLSAPAIEARRRARAQGGDSTGRQLIDRADVTFSAAKRARRQADRAGAGRRATRLADRADEYLRNAAAQIRIAQACPLDRGYLHALDLAKVQRIKAEVSRAFEEDAAALAVDTHRRIQDQRMRTKAEGIQR